MKPVRFHKKVRKELEALDSFTRVEIAELLTLIAKGESWDCLSADQCQILPMERMSFVSGVLADNTECFTS